MILPTSSRPLVIRDIAGQCVTIPEVRNVAVFPGSFNPLHVGHQQLCAAAESRLQREVIFEISTANVDKRPVEKTELSKRVSQFTSHRVAVTRAAKFVEKAILFPGCWFVVGFDTAERILDPRFYSNDDHSLMKALNVFLSNDHRFLVGGRLHASAATTEFCEVRHLKIPEGFENLFCGINEAEFRQDISSTQLRES